MYHKLSVEEKIRKIKRENVVIKIIAVAYAIFYIIFSVALYLTDKNVESPYFVLFVVLYFLCAYRSTKLNNGRIAELKRKLKKDSTQPKV